MASHKEYLHYVLDQLSGVEGITCRAMMGEYILYCRGKVIGGIYDNRLLLKPVPAAAELLPEATMERPYDGAKEMLRVDDVDNRELVRSVVETVYAGVNR